MESWRKVSIEDVLNPLTTVDPRKEPDRKFEYIDVSSVFRDTFSIERTSKLLGRDAPSRARRLVLTDDVIFATIRPTLQRIAIVPKHLNKAICSTGYYVLRPKSEVMSKFLFYYMFTQDFSDEMAMLQRGASYPAVSDRDVKKHVMLLPSLPEQERIVAILDEAFAAIATATANAEKNLANAREVFESELNRVFSKKGVGWMEKKLGGITDVCSGGTPLKSKLEYWNGDIPWYSSGELNQLQTATPDRFITARGIENSNAKLFPEGSLLIGMYDTAALKMSILDRDAAFNQAVAGAKPNDGLDLRFVLFAINSQKPCILKLRRGVRQKNLSLSKIKDISIFLPTLEEQSRIVELLLSVKDEVGRLKTIYYQKLTALKELKQSILQKAFTGELNADAKVADRTLTEAGL